MAREGYRYVDGYEYRSVNDLDFFEFLSSRGWWLVGFDAHAGGIGAYKLRRHKVSATRNPDKRGA